LLARNASPKMAAMARRDATKGGHSRDDSASVRSVEELCEPLRRALPVDFVAVRAQVVAALKSAGHASEAAHVRTLRRPTASVWAVNQLAHAQPAAVAAILALGAKVRADEAALSEGGDARDFMTEARVLRQQAVQVARRAEAFAAAAGVVVDAAAARRIAQTLQAAAVGDADARAALAGGRIADDASAQAGFGGATVDLAGALAASVGASAGQGAADAPGEQPANVAAGAPSELPAKDATQGKSSAADATPRKSPAKVSALRESLATQLTEAENEDATPRPRVGVRADAREPALVLVSSAKLATGDSGVSATEGADSVDRSEATEHRAAPARSTAHPRLRSVARPRSGGADAESAAAHANASAQRRAQALAHERAAERERRLAAAKHDIAVRRAEVDRARAACAASEARLHAAIEALAAAELAVRLLREADSDD
jgi:hypothetical protein